ncbi:MAG TPA: nuclear transport factor 2 family protein [Kofleriaceae bacterium]|nr:nuclear transport factor 2 family protein [Kofleriaceae bacterium]
MTLLAEPLVVYGPRRTDALASRSDALVALKQLVDPKAKKKPAMHAGDLAVITSPGGHSAWALDQMSLDGTPLTGLVVLSNTGDIWLVSAVALAKTPPMKSVRMELKQSAIVPTGMTGGAKLDPAARAAADKLTRGLAAQQVWGDDLASRTDAVVIGPAAGDVTRGKADIKKMWKKRVKQNVREVAVGDVAAAATPDGQLAWASAPVVRFMDDEEPLPLRVFAVFEKDGADWKMIALEEALAVDEPGAGAQLAKTPAPPLPKAADAPAPPPPADTTATPKKKKKKKKKPPPPSDDSG